MDRIAHDQEREHRIEMEAIVDCYGSQEQAMGWYYYLEDRICFPFEGTCIAERTISPLLEGEVVTVVSLAEEAVCECEMFVVIAWMNRTLGVPLSQLWGIAVDEETEEAIGDWHYWVGRGYRIC